MKREFSELEERQELKEEQLDVQVRLKQADVK